MSWRRVRLLGVLGAAIWVHPAAAHLLSTGFGQFYDGLLTPVTQLEDLLPILALAIWAGLRGPGLARPVVLALPVAWLVGMLAATHVPVPIAALIRPTVLVATLTATLIGIAGAANWSAPRAVFLIVATLLGVSHGLASAAGDGGVPLMMALGAAATSGVAFLLVAGQVCTLRIEWTRIMTRVLASWTAAVGLLQLGWFYRGM